MGGGSQIAKKCEMRKERKAERKVKFSQKWGGNPAARNREKRLLVRKGGEGTRKSRLGKGFEHKSDCLFNEGAGG